MEKRVSRVNLEETVSHAITKPCTHSIPGLETLVDLKLTPKLNKITLADFTSALAADQ